MKQCGFSRGVKISLVLASCVFGQAFAATPVATVPAPASVSNTAIFDDVKVKEIQNIVHDYLLKNPTILREMSQALRGQEMVKMQQDTKAEISKYAKELLDPQKHFVVGNPKGDVIMVEIFDYQCGHCKSMRSTIDKVVKEEPNLQVSFMEWPIFGADSVYAVKAALAAKEQNKYVEMHNALLDAENPLTKEKIMQVVKTVGLDEKKFEKDVGSKATEEIIKANTDLAQNLKLMATPAFIFINRKGDKFDFVLGESTEADLRKVVADIRK